MELKNVTDDAIDSGMEVDIVDTEKFIFDKANDEKILLGLFFIALSLSWLATKLNRRKGSQRERDTGPVKPSKLTKFLVSLPCCGISKLILTGICIIVTVVISTQNKDEQEPDARLDCLVFVTIYISFALSGLVDIFIFYSSTSSLLPKQCDGLILTLCFLIETLLVYFTEQDHCLLSIIVCCLVVSVLKMVHTTTILTFSLVIFTMVQGTWLLHSSFLPTSHSMTNIYFSWHLLAVFIITTTLNIIFHLLSRQERSSRSPQSTSTRMTTASSLDITTPCPVTINNPTGLTVKINHDAIARNKLNKSDDNLSKDSGSKAAASTNSDSEDNTSFASVPTQLASVVDSDHCERVSPLEEFNTLHRHCEGVRKSIKLKESSIV